MTLPLLSLVVWLPIVGGIVVMLIGSGRGALAKQVALGTSIVTFIVSIPLFTGFDGAERRDAVRRERAVDHAFRRELRARRGRHLDAARYC